MADEHKEDHNHHHERIGNIKVAFFLNFSFTILEIIGGIWTNSMAILSDALHDLGDSLSLGIAWYLEKYSGKGSDYKFSYGYARFSLLGALLNSVILIVGSIIILTQSIPRIFYPQEVYPQGMFIFAIIGILINGLAVLRLSHGSSLNERVVSWHLLEDVLGWVVVLIGSIILMFVDIPWFDPALSVLITIYVLYNVFKNLKETLNIFLEGVPKSISIEKIENEICEKTNVIKAYHTHIWSLDGEKNLLSLHIIVSDSSTREDIIDMKNQIRELMKENGIEHVTIEVDFKSEEFEY
ncbi:MAG: cation diffusion facilitator family transporter [Firmicutes bacterium]|nr:cation diffusion facilitator family transporter [Bacillota bacterium]